MRRTGYNSYRLHSVAKAADSVFFINFYLIFELHCIAQTVMASDHVVSALLASGAAVPFAAKLEAAR